jgi:tRNA pseudouridine55 synthase
MLDGVELIDKPIGFSSFQIVNILKKRYKKVGHTGTLDPFASGLLIVLIGNATKKSAEFQELDKEYIGEMMLGVITDTYDLSGRQIENPITRKDKLRKANTTIEKLNTIVQTFTGRIEQLPPKFSALKQKGRKLYELSRRGIEVVPKSRKVFVKSFRITGVDSSILKFNVVVGKGVYVRSLAYDFGNSLGCGATLISLRRTRIGSYDVAHARKIGRILEYDKSFCC